MPPVISHSKRFWALPPPEQITVVETEWEEFQLTSRSPTNEERIATAEQHLQSLIHTSEKFTTAEKIQWWGSVDSFDSAIEKYIQRRRAVLTRYRLGIFN